MAVPAFALVHGDTELWESTVVVFCATVIGGGMVVSGCSSAGLPASMHCIFLFFIIIHPSQVSPLF